MFANWTVDGEHYAFHKNWLYQQNFSNLRISEPSSKSIQVAYFYLSQLIQKNQFAMTDPVGTISWQIWQIFYPFPLKRCRRLKWMIPKERSKAAGLAEHYLDSGENNLSPLNYDKYIKLFPHRGDCRLRQTYGLVPNLILNSSIGPAIQRVPKQRDASCIHQIKSLLFLAKCKHLFLETNLLQSCLDISDKK